MPDPKPATKEEQRRLDQYKKQLISTIGQIRKMDPDFMKGQKLDTYVDSHVTVEKLRLHDRAVQKMKQIDSREDTKFGVTPLTSFQRTAPTLMDHSGTKEAKQKNEDLIFALSSRSLNALPQKEETMTGILNDIAGLDASQLRDYGSMEKQMDYAIDHYETVFSGSSIRSDMLGEANLKDMGLSVAPNAKKQVQDIGLYGETLGGIGRSAVQIASSDMFLTFPFDLLDSRSLSELNDLPTSPFRGQLNYLQTYNRFKEAPTPEVPRPAPVNIGPVFEETVPSYGYYVALDSMGSISETYARLTNDLKKYPSPSPVYANLMESLEEANQRLTAASSSTEPLPEENSPLRLSLDRVQTNLKNFLSSQKAEPGSPEAKGLDAAAQLRDLGNDLGVSDSNRFRSTLRCINHAKEALQRQLTQRLNAPETIAAAERVNTLASLAAASTTAQLGDETLTDLASDFTSIEFSNKTVNFTSDPKKSAQMLMGIAKWYLQNTIEMGKEAARLQKEEHLSEKQAVFVASCYSAPGIKRASANGSLLMGLGNTIPEDALPAIAKELGISERYEGYSKLLGAVTEALTSSYEKTLSEKERAEFELGKAAGDSNITSPGIRCDQTEFMHKYSESQIGSLLDSLPRKVEGMNFKSLMTRMQENSAVVGNSLDAMDNAFGSLAHSNTPTYNALHDALSSYCNIYSTLQMTVESTSSNPTMDSFQDVEQIGQMTKMADRVVQTAAAYLSDKWKDRGSHLGQVRFDKTMDILQRLSPEVAKKTQDSLNATRAAHGLKPLKFGAPEQKSITSSEYIDKTVLSRASKFVPLKDQIQAKAKEAREELSEIPPDQRLTPSDLRVKLAKVMLGENLDNATIDKCRNAVKYDDFVAAVSDTQAFQEVTKGISTGKDITAFLNDPNASKKLMVQYSKLSAKEMDLTRADLGRTRSNALSRGRGHTIHITNPDSAQKPQAPQNPQGGGFVK